MHPITTRIASVPLAVLAGASKKATGGGSSSGGGSGG